MVYKRILCLLSLCAIFICCNKSQEGKSAIKGSSDEIKIVDMSPEEKIVGAWTFDLICDTEELSDQQREWVDKFQEESSGLILTLNSDSTFIWEMEDLLVNGDWSVESEKEPFTLTLNMESGDEEVIWSFRFRDQNEVELIDILTIHDEDYEEWKEHGLKMTMKRAE